MITPKVSIIIPCYNSSKTLQQAFESCFKQNLHPDEFEIILVDDGSIDTTPHLLHTYTQSHPNVHAVHHHINQGGGAARNSGIAVARGTYIYCLDSDNILGHNMLRRCVDFIAAHRYDGVVIQERHFFSASPTHIQHIICNDILDRPLQIQDIFEKRHPVMIDNFLFSKNAYAKTGGYPEHHGFDTQAFEIRFLVAGCTLHVCPNTMSYHRQAMAGQTTYFEREFNKGIFSINYFLIAEDMLSILSPYALNTIITYPIFTNNSLHHNLLTHMEALAQQHQLCTTHTNSVKPSLSADHFMRCITAYHTQQYDTCRQHINYLQTQYPDSEVIAYLLYRLQTTLTHPQLQGKSLEQHIHTHIHTQTKITRHILYKWYHKIPIIMKWYTVYKQWRKK